MPSGIRAKLRSTAAHASTDGARMHRSCLKASSSLLHTCGEGGAAADLPKRVWRTDSEAKEWVVSRLLDAAQSYSIIQRIF